MQETIRKYSTGYTQVLNALLYDKALSLRAKGLYAYLFSKPDGWQFYVSAMQTELQESEAMICNAVKELISAGYIRREQVKENGKFCGVIYEFVPSTEKPSTEKPSTEKPSTEKPSTEKPSTEKPSTEKRGTNNTYNKVKLNLSNTEKSKTESLYKEKEINKEKESYAFEGKVIKLRQSDFDKWAELYPNLNLKGELFVRDMWLAEQPLEVQKRWFMSTSQYFIKQDAIRKKQNEGLEDMPSTDKGEW